MRLTSAPIDQDATDRRIGLHRDLGIVDPPRAHHFEAELLDLGRDLVHPHPFEIVRGKGRRTDQQRETPKIIHGTRLSSKAERPRRPALRSCTTSLLQFESIPRLGFQDAGPL
jgi:hypothetical protein